MTATEALAQIVRGDAQPIDAPSEGAWHSIWSERRLDSAAPLAAAMLGGAMADRLPWVFVAGYQAAIRRVFSEVTEDGWACFAVSEDRSGELPGVALADAGSAAHLNGHKTWVAASDHVRQLVIGIGAGAEQRFALVARDDRGVSIETYEPGDFLAELSQGRASFDETPLASRALLAPSDHGRRFGVAESLHVLTALNAFMLSHARGWADASTVVGEATAGLHTATSLAAGDLTSQPVAVGLAGFSRQTVATAEAFEALAENADPRLHGRWTAERRLVEMYGSGTARRAEAALEA